MGTEKLPSQLHILPWSETIGTARKDVSGGIASSRKEHFYPGPGDVVQRRVTRCAKNVPFSDLRVRRRLLIGLNSREFTGGYIISIITPELLRLVLDPITIKTRFLKHDP